MVAGSGKRTTDLSINVPLPCFFKRATQWSQDYTSNGIGYLKRDLMFVMRFSSPHILFGIDYF